MTGEEMVRIARLANETRLEAPMRAIYVFQCYEYGQRYGIQQLTARATNNTRYMLVLHQIPPDVSAQLVRFFN